MPRDSTGAVYGILSRHAVRLNEVEDLPRSGPAMGCVGNYDKLDLADIHEILTAQKCTDHIFRPHVEPNIDNHALEES